MGRKWHAFRPRPLRLPAGKCTRENSPLTSTAKIFQSSLRQRTRARAMRNLSITGAPLGFGSSTTTTPFVLSIWVIAERNVGLCDYDDERLLVENLTDRKFSSNEDVYGVVNCIFNLSRFILRNRACDGIYLFILQQRCPRLIWIFKVYIIYGSVEHFMFQLKNIIFYSLRLVLLKNIIHFEEKTDILLKK